MGTCWARKFHPACDRFEAIHQPLFLRGSQHSRARILHFGAGKLDVVAAGLIGSVLPRVEHRDARERPVRERAVELQQRAFRNRRAPQRHVLVDTPCRLRPGGARTVRSARLPPGAVRRSCCRPRDRPRRRETETARVPRAEPDRFGTARSDCGSRLPSSARRQRACAPACQRPDLRRCNRRGASPGRGLLPPCADTR